ncbi:MAG: PhzF family phenazine biosynthesis isomerase [Candidatus Aminicenantes bacterium]|nr:PhzF family phenazine biosynthesis isomerase [Candidatus Aminicenantes bacterium]
MNMPIYQVDAFTNKLFGGNPAAVCPLEKWLDAELMQKIAAENNLSETAFFVKGDKGFELRWFTPKVEVDLCGHGTLATAHVIFNHLDYDEKQITFSSASGELRVTTEDGLITLDFPSTPPSPVEIVPELTQGLGLEPKELHKSRDYLALFETEDDILSIKPDFDILGKLNSLGIIITAPGGNSDFVSRFFAPAAGINEDPVTGSAHTTLIPFWAGRLNKNTLHAFQLSERRGELFCELSSDRVKIGGYAVTFFKGEIVL